MAQFRNYKFTLGAGEQISPSIQGNFIHVYDGSGTFTLQPQGLNPVEMQKGIGMNFERQFNNCYIKNGSTAQTIEIYAGDGRVYDNRLVTSGGVNIKSNTGASYGTETVGTTAVSILPSNASRATALIANTSSYPIYIGNDNLVTTATGMPVGAGQSITVTFDDAVWGIAATTSLDVRYIEETN